jgi:17beta-estradiol 17-dehydrogenase / very-long-chain 3-oxoacyl-CoA reductase
LLIHICIFYFKTEEEYGVQAKAVAVDLGQGREATDKVWKEIQGLDIGILGNLFECTSYNFVFSESLFSVNNAATSGGLPNYFVDLNRNEMWNLYNLNMSSVTDLVYLALAGMKSRRRGLIVNVSSVASLAPNPFASIYAASKVYYIAAVFVQKRI